MNRTVMIVALAATYFVFAMLLNSVAPVILQSMLTFGVDKIATSTLDACKDLPIAITSLAAAAYIPRLGYRRAMVLGLGFVALACTAMPLLPGFVTTRLMFVAVGVGFALVKVSVYSSIGLLTSSARRHASLTSLLEGLFMVGVLSTSWVFSIFINRNSPADPVWLHVYWLFAAIAAAAALLVAFAKLDESAVRAAEPAGESPIPGMLNLLRHREVLVFVVAAFLYVLIEQEVQTWLPTFNREELQLPVTLSVQLASLYSGALALGRLTASIALRHIYWRNLLIGCLIAAACALLLSVRASGAGATDWASLPLAAYLPAVIGLFLAPIYPTICSTMLCALPLEKHAPMTGLIVVFSALGGTSGSFITGRIFAATDGRTAFTLGLVPMALLIGGLYLFDRSLRARAPQPAVAAG
ncbi:MAG TPA: MFS transporter [Steroidobacteraceae bacterium]|nr:MFS transporter [Steroidobacteraceae bacterium]